MVTKISDLRGEDIFDVLADLIEPITNIATDPAIAAGVVAAGEDEEGPARSKAIIAFIKGHVPTIIKTHKADLVGILAAIKRVTREEYARDLTAIGLLGDVLNILNDKELTAFFESWSGTTTTEDSPSILMIGDQDDTQD